jgi:SAM-dependent methyltransferase
MPLNGLAANLRCPLCHREIEIAAKQATCRGCREVFPIADDQIYFSGTPEQSEGSSHDILFRLKAWLKHQPTLFRLAYLLQPALAVGQGPDAIVSPANPHPTYLNLGSGAPLYWKAGGIPMVQVDLHPYPGVDLVCDAGRLPYADNSVDGIYNESLMEHVPEPARIVEEVRRILKPGGHAYFVLPQIAPFHAAPHDYTRWTIPGGKELLKNFKLEECGVRHGPVSAWLWQTQELIATALSFGQAKIYAVILMVLMAATFPIKYLDLLMARWPDADRVALTLYFLVRKES